MNLRRLAKGKPCEIRLPGCDGGGATTVLAHFRLAGYSGVGQKPNDLLGAWACQHCHAVVDGRLKLAGTTATDRRLAHAIGVMRTLATLVDGGVLTT